MEASEQCYSSHVDVCENDESKSDEPSLARGPEEIPPERAATWAVAFGPESDDEWNEDHSGNELDPIPVRPGARRDRQFKTPISSDLEEGLELMETKLVRIKPFGVGRQFANSTEFLHAWTQYEKETFTKYISRTANFVPTENKRREDARVAKGRPHDDEFAKTVIPAHLIHAKIVRRCTKGVYAQPRGTGQRKVTVSKWLRCDARITCDAVADATGQWTLTTRDEFNDHNHSCDEAMLESNGKSAILQNPEILAEVSRLLQARAPARNICDTLNTNFGIKITPKQLANLKRDRLGGQGAICNLKLLLGRFASFPGSHCTLIDDQEGQICGVLMQSAAQKKMLEMYGDNLILDWTHNTNNLGFFLGSLMVTGVSGRGVSVFDFLCLEQTEAMMTTVFTTFLNNNPGAIVQMRVRVMWRILCDSTPKNHADAELQAQKTLRAVETAGINASQTTKKTKAGANKRKKH